MTLKNGEENHREWANAGSGPETSETLSSLVNDE